jgi:hypothetical protein
MKNDKLIISYRRKCRNAGQETGLSHYITYDPEGRLSIPNAGWRDALRDPAKKS